MLENDKYIRNLKLRNSTELNLDYLMMIIPIPVARSPTKIDKITYKIAVVNSPLSINEKVSAENAEKVVNPPQNPVESKNLDCSDKDSGRWIDSPTRNPMIKQPMIFTVNVPNGKPELVFS